MAVVFPFILVVALAACCLSLRDVVSHRGQEFAEIGQSRRLWTWVFVGLLALVILSTGMLSPAALAMAAMLSFLYRRRFGPTAPDGLDGGEPA
ncbi:MAG: hypothetical protein GY713_20540 [Actinomycetia bacterium]|nr:hypothetical protein [Actinomycetes bacterium]